MSLFRPTRSSPRVKPTPVLEQYSDTHSTTQDTSLISSPELANLTHNEIELIDTVIERAGPSATTFLTVFKAYNDVLSERGLDPQEVLYYGKLLKLGTIKGKNWGEKWDMVKSGIRNQRNHGGSTAWTRSKDKPQSMVDARPKSASRRVHGRANVPLKPVENVESLSSWRSTTAASSLHEEPSSISQFKSRVSLDRDKRSILLESPSVRESRPKTKAFESLLSSPRGRSSPPETASTTSRGIPLSTPPSYSAAARDAKHPMSLLQRIRTRPETMTSASSSISEVAHMLTGQNTTGALNESIKEDPWKKIMMKRDEEDADLLRADRLQERCYQIWKQGYQWIITTNQQVAEAHDNLLLRISIQKWRDKLEYRQRFERSAVAFYNSRCLKTLFERWHHRLDEKKKVRWRDDMRRRMRTLQEKRHARIQREGWLLWRQAYLCRFADQQYERNLEARIYERWKKRLSANFVLDDIADEFYDAQRTKERGKYFKDWHRAVQLRGLGGIMTHRIHLRLFAMVWEKWRNGVYVYRKADKFHIKFLLKRAVHTWKGRRNRLRVIEGRADKYRARQNLVLMIAAARVWRARERGQVLERVKDARLIAKYLERWRRRKRENEQQVARADAFATRPNSLLLISALNKWHTAYATREKMAQTAQQYHVAQSKYNFVLKWRLQLRSKWKLAKVARRADEIFSTRRAWDRWLEAMSERARERRVDEFERKKVENLFHAWSEKARKARQQRVAENTVREKIKQRLLSNCLSRWTNSVIEVKLRELEVVQACNTNKLGLAYRKWKRVHQQHAEQVNLLESYELVKKEETLRRVFGHWLTSSRANRHRRELFTEKEQEMKERLLARVWETWREKYVEEKLLPVEQTLAKQMMKNLMFRAFGGWYAKTKTLPAIKLHNENVRYKYFAVWRAAMPKAMQAKEAKEVFRRNALAKYLDRWLREYRTRMALKAVARARYLRLPASTTPRPRSSVSGDSARATAPAPQPIVRGRSHQLASQRMRERSGSPDRTSVASAPVLAPWKSRHRRSILGQRSVGETSPARSVFGGSATVLETGSGAAGGDTRGDEEGGRGRLWNELRAIQRRSRPSSRA